MRGERVWYRNPTHPGVAWLEGPKTVYRILSFIKTYTGLIYCPWQKSQHKKYANAGLVWFITLHRSPHAIDIEETGNKPASENKPANITPVYEGEPFHLEARSICCHFRSPRRCSSVVKIKLNNQPAGDRSCWKITFVARRHILCNSKRACKEDRTRHISWMGCGHSQ